MNSRKTLAIALTAWISIQVTPDGFANERDGYGPNTIVLSTVASSLLTTMAADKVADFFRPARANALAFIGSDGEIRGAQFEQAVQHYRSISAQHRMSELQLAQAIAAIY
ncbi:MULTISPECIES: DUF2388 domain-containing protein [Pseudomonas syringae group]|nr:MULTISPECIES: DUF2388 domain-containing protein [Pseudomonas syringae group]EGH12709.1 hypothetical protein PSYMP_22041 [Pseudomonas amygdali pv. morsprunorum str. M302280]KWS62287.1 hypothetical protein AL055_26895 [Pseudomonas amygdali pv. morsprunorum]PHN43969.1 hypothetical protein AO261_22475 [Pseudomonas avellanae]POC88104.1 hypothetical protein BKM26_18995 [Pseudomonas avellanae]POD03449.1 hypothetical protein BKM20_21880 [Pseudomonas avellanae]